MRIIISVDHFDFLLQGYGEEFAKQSCTDDESLLLIAFQPARHNCSICDKAGVGMRPDNALLVCKNPYTKPNINATPTIELACGH